MNLTLTKDFSEEEIAYLNTLSKSELKELLTKCERASVAANTAQINRKLLINSLYGALGNIFFRFYDLRNAVAITSFGQLAIQWIERNINEYLNRLLKTENVAYVIYGDTDSVYICIDKLIEHVGEDKFRDTNHWVDFLDKFGREKMEPAIDKAYRELCDYMNNYQHMMFMDREAIAGPPLGSDGIGGFWTAKKRYALNVWDMEGTRFAEPKLKIMGLETQRSSTPKAVQKALKESIRRMLQEGESSLQEYYKDFDQQFRTIHYSEIAAVSSANNLAKWTDAQGYPIKSTPYHIKGVLAYNRMVKGHDGLNPIMEGEKVKVIPLRSGNPYNEACMSWPSGSKLPRDYEADIIKWIDYTVLFNKTFVKPLEAMTDAARLNYVHKNSLFDLFDI